MIQSKNKLFNCSYPNEEATHRLFCFPSAGGDANMFRDWYQYLPDTEVWGVTFPGRGMLSKQSYPSSLQILCELLLNELESYSDKPLVFFGHSFGALVSYALAIELERLPHDLQAFFACARRAPNCTDLHGFKSMSKQDVLEKLTQTNSIPLAITESPELLDYYLEVIIKDLQLNETVIDSTQHQLKIPVYIYSGLNDKFVGLEEMNDWTLITKGPVTQYTFEGDHFFIANMKEAFLDQFSLDMDVVQGIEEDQTSN